MRDDDSSSASSFGFKVEMLAAGSSESWHLCCETRKRQFAHDLIRLKWPF